MLVFIWQHGGYSSIVCGVYGCISVCQTIFIGRLKSHRVRQALQTSTLYKHQYYKVTSTLQTSTFYKHQHFTNINIANINILQTSTFYKHQYCKHEHCKHQHSTFQRTKICRCCNVEVFQNSLLRALKLDVEF